MLYDTYLICVCCQFDWFFLLSLNICTQVHQALNSFKVSVLCCET